MLAVGVIVAATPLVLGLVALLRGRKEDIPVIMRALQRRDVARRPTDRTQPWSWSLQFISAMLLGIVIATVIVLLLVKH